MSTPPILETVCKASGLDYPKGKCTQDFLARLVKVAVKLPIPAWNALPRDAQEWLNTCITATRESITAPKGQVRALPSPDDFDPDYKPSKTITVPEPVSSEPAQESTPARASKSDGSTGAEDRKGAGEGKKAKPGRPAKAKKVVRRKSSTPETVGPRVVRRRKRSRGSSSGVVKFALAHGINDWDRLCVELQRNNIKASDSTVQAGLYGIRQVVRAMDDLGAHLPAMLAAFLHENVSG